MPQALDLNDPTVQRIVFSLLILLAAGVLIRIGQRLAARYLDTPARLYRISKLISRTAAVTALLLILALWASSFKNLLTVLTVVGAGLAISMREALLSFVGWINIVVRSPFRQGDRIEVNGICGDVIDIRLLHTSLMEIGNWVDADQSTGRIVHFPNQWVFNYGVKNYTLGFNYIWNEMSILLTPESDWESVRELMLELAGESAKIVEQQAAAEIRQTSRDYLVHYSILTPFVYVRLTDKGIRLTLRYLCEVRKRRGTEHALTVSLLKAIAGRKDVKLAEGG